ncbi:DUF6545 domain-containing protein [Streptomyces sp. NPDC102282]|uniref:DUF6545 domain-containing protein n=1 Tax=Streptomyces sp. NPDC102282 TaxID=3366154 RepID=UPI0038135645
MLESALTAADLTVFLVCFTVGCAKALAARSDRGTALRLTASVLLCASLVYLLSAPAVYRAVGRLSGEPGLASLLVYVAILVCVGHAHALTHVWHPRRRATDALRRSILLWVPVYGLATTAMTVLFFAADLSGPTRPLTFATDYATEPTALAMQLVYLTALVVGIVATVRQCRGPDGVIALPGRPDLEDSLRLFAAAVALDLVYVACTATAAVSAALGHHALDPLAAYGSVASGTSALIASYGLAKPALAARRTERADHAALLVLWHLVTDGGADSPFPARPSWWNRYALSDVLAEILDGTYRLRPWMDPAVAPALAALAKASPRAQGADVPALQAAATIRHAHQRRREALTSGLPTPTTAGDTPVDNTPPTLVRDRQVRIANHLSHPLVDETLTILRATST